MIPYPGGGILNGSINISRTTSNKEDDYVSIRLTDKDSGLLFAKIKLSMEQYGSVISGVGNVDAEIKYFPGGYGIYGMIYRVKHEIVPHTFDKGMPVGQIQDILGQYEVDGWEADTSQLFNHHYVIDGGTRVAFSKYVDKSEVTCPKCGRHTGHIPDGSECLDYQAGDNWGKPNDEE